MDEVTKTMEESAQPVTETGFSSAPSAEVIKQQEDISEKWTPAQLRAARKKYINDKKEDIEILAVDVQFLRLQVEHYHLTKDISKINAEIEEMKKLKESESFKESIKI